MSTISIGRLLGASRLSKVYQATCNDRHVAIKCILSTEHSHLLQQEFRCLQTLHHPNIVKAHDWFDRLPQTGKSAFTMTQINGINGKVLAERLQRLPPAERHQRVIQIGMQLGSALSHIHTQGWLHRDIKPSNLMFEQETQVLLIDFGTVTPYPMPTQQKGLVGTPRFASPEQLHGEILTPSSDLFSLGATLYYLLLNTRPFEGRDRSTPMPPSLIDPSIPQHLNDILMQCLRLNPEGRFASMTLFMQALSQVAPKNQPLAGREQTIQDIAHCLQRVHQGEQLHVHFQGTRGSGKKWGQQTLLEATHQHRVPCYILNTTDPLETILDQIAKRQPLIVCSSQVNPPKIGLPLIPIQLSWLNLSEVRRSLFSHAPKTPALVQKAQWLHQQTNGIPALLLPMLIEYTIRSAFHIPQEPEVHIPKSWFEDLNPFRWSLLQLLSYSKSAMTLETIQLRIPQTKLSDLEYLEQQSLIIQQGSYWRMSCTMISDAIKRHHPLSAMEQQEWNLLSTPTPTSNWSAQIQNIEIWSAKGKLSQAQQKANDILSSIPTTHKASVLLQLGQVKLDIGHYEQARIVLADATALSNGDTDRTIYLRSQALRAHTSLEQHNGSPIGAMHALDRISKLTSTGDPWVISVWQWSLGALGDIRQWNKHLEQTRKTLQKLDQHHYVRCVLNLIRGACAVGDLDTVHNLISEIKPGLAPYALLEWEIRRLESILLDTPPPKVGRLVYNLSAEDILQFKKRWIRVKGKHPDPTWYL